MRETGKGPLEALKDPLYRLTRADRTNPGATPPNQWTWNYDAVGNRTSAQKDSEATTSSHNEKNQLTGTSGGGKMLWRGTLDEPGNVNLTNAAASINGQPARMLAGNVFEAELNLPAGANTVTIQAQDGSGNIATKAYSVNVLGVPSSYTYDANGNLVTKTEGTDAWTYTWNALNQLIAAAKNTATQATYKYDPHGRRIERVAGATTTTWTYEGEDIARQTAGATTVFVHGPGFDEPLAQTLGTTTEYFHSDALGSIVSHTSSAGAIATSIAYDGWGNIESGIPSLHAFTGREWDPTTALYYYRARYYEPSSGRFLSEDPIGFAGGGNFYQYGNGNPVLLSDPTGLQAITPNTGAQDAYYKFCCKDKKFSFCPGNLPAPTDSCLNTCAIKHEEKHAKDFSKDKCLKNYCADKPDGETVKASEADKKKYECRAHKETWKCIKKCAPSPEKTKMEKVAFFGQWDNCGTGPGPQPQWAQQ